MDRKLKSMRNNYYSLLNLLSFFFRRFYKNRLRVLAYHDITDETLFSKHIRYLKSRYKLIDISQLQKHLFNNENLPEYPLLITFDDGDYTVLENALPVLKKYNSPACLFIITSLINTDKDFWWNVIHQDSKKSGDDIKKTAMKIKHLKNISNLERLSILKNYISSKKRQLSTEELVLLDNNNVFIGNHSHTHPMFDKCTQKEIRMELTQSRSSFKSWGLEGYNIFAYPNGNHDEFSEKVLKEKNICLAFLFDHKINSSKMNALRISRIRTNSDMSIEELKVKVSGLHSFLINLKIR